MSVISFIPDSSTTEESVVSLSDDESSSSSLEVLDLEMAMCPYCYETSGESRKILQHCRKKRQIQCAVYVTLPEPKVAELGEPAYRQKNNTSVSRRAHTGVIELHCPIVRTHSFRQTYSKRICKSIILDETSRW